MNDFTKQELECLHNAIALQLRDIPMSEINAIRRSELVGKLQSMIDNYCEHEFYLNGCGEAAFAQCHMCGEVKKVMRNE